VTEELCTVGDVELCYERFGDPRDPALLLVMGLGTQMLGWHDDFCTQLAGRGFHVIRFDNRDIGRSSRLSHIEPPTLRQLLRRDKAAAGYTLADMADDAVGILDCLGIERAHVAGASMGGMIAQTIAIRHPDRVLSLASIMSNTGGRWRGQPGLRIYPIFLRRPPRGRDAYVEHTVRLYRTIGSTGFDREEDDLREIAARGFDRGVDAAGSARQLAAIVAAHDRTPELRELQMPTVVVHGTADRMVSPSGGRATAKAIPDARLVLIDGLGHDLPRGVWPQLLEAISGNAARADGAARAAA
jgi:pimeloyl-ACP methyl ester carboxylesterase